MPRTPLKRWKLCLAVVGVILVLLLALLLEFVAGGILLGGALDPPAPSDASLRAVFDAHEAKFNALRDMIFSEPSLQSIGDDNVRNFWLSRGKWERSPDPHHRRYSEKEMLEQVGLDEDRYRTYRSLLKSVGAYRVKKGGNYKEGVMAVCIYRAGLSISGGEEKKIVYLPEPAEPEWIVEDTGAHREEIREGRVWGSAIRDGWYIVWVFY